MALDRSKVIYGTARIFRDDHDPTGTLAIPDPDAQGFADPGGTFNELGLTQDNMELRSNVDYAEIVSDQLIDPVARPAEARDSGITANMIEITPQNLQYALGLGATASVAAGVGTRGIERFTLDDDVTEELAAILVDFQTPGNGEFGRLFLPAAKPISSITTPFGARTDAVQINADWAALPDTSRDPVTIFVLEQYTPATA